MSDPKSSTKKEFEDTHDRVVDALFFSGRFPSAEAELNVRFKNLLSKDQKTNNPLSKKHAQYFVYRRSFSEIHVQMCFSSCWIWTRTNCIDAANSKRCANAWNGAKWRFNWTQLLDGGLVREKWWNGIGNYSKKHSVNSNFSCEFSFDLVTRRTIVYLKVVKMLLLPLQLHVHAPQMSLCHQHRLERRRTRKISDLVQAKSPTSQSPFGTSITKVTRKR